MPETTIKSLVFAPDLLTNPLSLGTPSAVTEIMSPLFDEVVSPPTKSTL